MGHVPHDDVGIFHYAFVYLHQGMGYATQDDIEISCYALVCMNI